MQWREGAVVETTKEEKRYTTYREKQKGVVQTFCTTEDSRIPIEVYYY
jgi:hypothetical protein